MSVMNDWAKHWGVPQEAVVDLKKRLSATEDSLPTGASEARAQQEVRLNATRFGARLWRNNVGAYTPPEGGHVRYGLCNESQAMNKALKSSDLIGITPVVVPQRWVGYTVGIFTAIEVKRAGHKVTGKGREEAQMAYLELVSSLGGYAAFSTGEFPSASWDLTPRPEP